MNMTKRPVWIIDTSLRDGIRTSGMQIDYDRKYAIAKTLVEIGVNEIEAGIPAEGREEKEFLHRLNEDFQDTVITAWCEGHVSHIQDALESSIESIHIAFPVSDVQLRLHGMSREDLLDSLDHVLCSALGNFSHISIGAQDASRADADFLKLFIKSVGKYGVRRIRIADTTRIWDPPTTVRMIRDIKEYSGAFLEFHGHDNFGKASANAISAIQAGADAVSTILGGLCDETGNTELEEFLIYLAFAGRHRATIELENLLAINTSLYQEEVGNVESW
ncbi:MAG: hypothetical protein JEY99_11550 [Spirochaetales bacterium]|nr:hypothetical protein [Spirochaetales bacterium]